MSALTEPPDQRRLVDALSGLFSAAERSRWIEAGKDILKASIRDDSLAPVITGQAAPLRRPNVAGLRVVSRRLVPSRAIRTSSVLSEVP